MNRKIRLLGLCFAAAVGLFYASSARAEEAPQTLSGKIQVERDGLAIKKATITTAAEEILNILLDEKGMDFVKVMAGGNAELSAVVFEKDNQKWARVLGYTDPQINCGHELWRRMRCNACAVSPAGINATAPKDLQGAAAAAGRFYSQKEKFRAWARDAKYLWLATDTRILQIDLAKKSLLKSYDRKNTLPDQIIFQLASDGKTLWIAYKGGVAALKIGEDNVKDLPSLKCNFARIFLASDAAWIIADTGTFKLKNADEPPEVLPALPTSGQIAQTVQEGIWIADWEKKTAHFAASPQVLDDRLYVDFYGDIYALADGNWSKIAGQSWNLKAAAGRLWFLNLKGLAQYDSKTGETRNFVPPELADGRMSDMLVDESSAWVTVEPNPLRGVSAGGLARLDLASLQWQTWQEINGQKADHVTCLKAADGAVWAVSAQGQESTKAAHPGMTYVTRKIFEATGFQLNRFDPKTNRWDSYPLSMVELDKRLICGQDGGSAEDTIVPQTVEDLCVGADRIFGTLRLLPRQYFSGYWPSIGQISSRPNPNDPWKAQFEHHPEQLDLQGEQPTVLNISNKGEMFLEAVGHNNVLGMFMHDGTPWAITEGCAAHFDGGQWQKAAENGFHFYWRATAALDDGKSLYVGSDRGLVSRLDFETGQFEILTTLKDRSISRIFKDKNGDILVDSVPGPLGILPVQLRDSLKQMDCAAARFDGKSWSAAQGAEAALAQAKNPWFFKQLDKRHPMDKSMGNFLFGPSAEGAEAKPVYYVKEVFFPDFLTASSDGRRLWIATYTGLLRLDQTGK